MAGDYLQKAKRALEDMHELCENDLSVEFSRGTKNTIYQKGNTLLKIERIRSFYTTPLNKVEKQILREIEPLKLPDGTQFEQNMLKESIIKTIYNQEGFNEAQKIQSELLTPSQYKIAKITTPLITKYKPLIIQQKIQGESLDQILKPKNTIFETYNTPHHYFEIHTEKKDKEKIILELEKVENLYLELLKKDQILDITLAKEPQQNTIINIADKLSQIMLGRGNIKSNFIYDGENIKMIDVETIPYEPKYEYLVNITKEQIRKTITS